MSFCTRGGKRKGIYRVYAFLMSLVLFIVPSIGYVNAGEMLGQTDFNDGVGLPWHIVESATGQMEFEIKDGVYCVTIVNPGGASNGGEDRWDCQFRHRGLKIISGHQYQVKYEITPSNAGKYYTKIGNLDGNVEVWHNMSNGYDLDNTWDPITIGANETKKVDLTFTANQTIEVAEWAFHLGGDGQYTDGGCFPAGTVIKFDNMSLVDLTSNENDYVKEEPYVRSEIMVNQLGYFTDRAKKATMLSDADGGVQFEIIDESGNSVYTGKSTAFGKDEDSEDTVNILDFSDFTEKGTYYIKTSDGKTSKTFEIGNSVKYSALLYDALNYFYQNRSAIEIKSDYITSGDVNGLARAAGHTTDNAEIFQTWGYTATSGTQDVTGGWYDAGDHGKYVVNGGIALWIMQNQYEMAKYNGTEAAYADGTMNIPENNNGYPDILDEARWEMEWMFKMMVKSGDCEGMAYHKVNDDKWTALGMSPAEDTQKRLLFPPTTAATLNLSACAAQSARLWKGIDDSFSETCLEAAKKSYDAAKAHPDMYAPLAGDEHGGGAYGDDNVTDEFYWAACELYITTGDKTYYDDMKASSHFLKLDTKLSGGESVDTFASFDWGHTAALGTLSLAINKDAVSESDYKTVKDNITAAADTFIAKEKEQGYGLPYAQSTLSASNSEKGYIWGSNSFVVDNGIVIAYAYTLTGKDEYINGVAGALDYILGRNANDISYVTGYGTHTSKYPHHRYWANQIDPSFPLAPCGVLVGGPNSGMEDPWVQGSGWKTNRLPAQKSYLDHIEAWSANECTINWNAPLAWLTGYITEKSDDGIIIGSTGNGNGIHLGDASGGNGGNGNDGGDGGETDTAESVVSVKDDKAKASNEKTETAEESTAKEKEDKDKGGFNIKMLALILAVAMAFIISLEVFAYKMFKLSKETKANNTTTISQVQNNAGDNSNNADNTDNKQEN